MSTDRVPLSGKELSINEIEKFMESTEEALRLYYHQSNPLFTGYLPEELLSELDDRLEELDRCAVLSAIAAIEAHLRIDFLQRCCSKRRDTLSRKFRHIHKKKSKISLSDDILELWMDHVTSRSPISELRSALNYRHWLAHGRYWVAKLGRAKYDFRGIVTLAVFLQSEMDIDMGA